MKYSRGRFLLVEDRNPSEMLFLNSWTVLYAFVSVSHHMLGVILATLSHSYHLGSSCRLSFPSHSF